LAWKKFVKIIYYIGIPPHPIRRYPYFGAVVGLVWLYDPESSAVAYATGRAPPMPDRSRVMTQTKRDTLALQVGGWA
jgi:hypothetical protein